MKSTGNLDESDSETLLAQEAGPAAEELINLLGLFVTQKPAFEELAAQVPDIISDTKNALEGFAGTTQVRLRSNSKCSLLIDDFKFHQNLINALNENTSVCS